MDGELVAQIRNGKSISITAEDGRHEVCVQLDWCRSAAICVEVAPSCVVHLVTGCYAKGWRLFLAFIYILIPGWYVYLDRACPN